MAHLLGTMPELGARSLLGTLKARLTDVGRRQLEMEEGHGLRRLVELLRSLPDTVTAVIHPSLGFMQVDAVVAAPGRLLVVNTLHWRGEVAVNEKGAWTGAGGRVGLGRPDRRAFTFADRLRFSGRTEGFAVAPLVLCTAGSVQLLADDAEAELVAWAEAAQRLRDLAAGSGPDPVPLVKEIFSITS